MVDCRDEGGTDRTLEEAYTDSFSHHHIVRTAVSYLNEQFGEIPLASIDNLEAKALIAKMRLEVQDDKPRFADKSIVEYFSVMQKVVKSAVDK
jgi:hypothetical protein